MKKLTMFIIAVSAIAFYSFSANAQEVRFFSHRGGRMEFDENTMQAFEASYKAGYRGFETDIRMTKDGELFITHDSNLERTTNGTGVLEEKTADEIKALDTKKGNKMLLFDEFVKWIASKGDMEYVEFELKTKPEKYYPEDKLHEYCDRIYKSVMAVKPANALFIITSSDERGLLYIKNKYPDAQLLWIVSKPVNDETIDKCLSLGIPRIGAMLEGTSRAMVKKAHDKGLIVSLWPSHTIDDIMLGVYLGSNTLCTDIPIQTKKFITKKAKWIKAEF